MLAVLTHDVLLHQPAVVDLAYILHEHGRAVHDFHRDVVKLIDRRRHRVRTHEVLSVADLCGTGWQGEILRIDRSHDIEWCEPPRYELRGVDVDHDLAVFAAGGRRQCQARNGRELLADAVDAVVVELLFIQRVRAERDLQDRHARGIELHDDRRLDAGGHQRADRVGRRDDLRDGEVEVYVLLEVDLLHRQARQGLGFDVADAVHVGADGVLAVGRDPLLHLRRAEAGVAPDHRDHRNADLGEDVGSHRIGRDAAEEGDQRCHDVERVGKAQREPDDTHGSLPGAIRCPKTRATGRATTGAGRAAVWRASARSFSARSCRCQ